MSEWFPSAGGFLPRLQFDAKAAKLFKVEKSKGDDGRWNKRLVEIELPKFAALVDLDSIRKGYANFTGDRPEERMVPWTSKLPERPPGEDAKGKPRWSPHVKFTLKLAVPLGGEIREFSSGSMTVLGALKTLIDGWMQDPAASDPSKCPVLRISGTTAISSKYGLNHAPVFQTTGWRPRPDDMPLASHGDEGDDDGDGFSGGETTDIGQQEDPFPGGVPTEEPKGGGGGGDDSDLPF